MLVVLGDLHFRSDYPWFVESTEHFLKWFDDWNLNNSSNELLLLGDLVERPVNGGIVIDFLERLHKYTKFRKLHIVVGNHDFKRIDKVYQLAYDFLKRKKNVVIYEEKTDVVIQGMSCLILPFLPSTVEIPSPYKYYSNLYKNPKENYKRDILFGHIQDKNFPGDSVKNLEKLADNICLGHIHSRVHKNYIGSLTPNNHSQNGQRYFRTYQKLNDKIIIMMEDPLPNFLEFHIIKYGDDISDITSLTPVFVIHECPEENLIDSKYDNLHIKKYYRAKIREVGVKDKTSRKNTKEYFKDFIKQSSITFNRNTIKTCKEALKL